VAATLSLVLILVEAAIGAGLVLFELVGNNSSILRAVIIAIHLANTFLLLGAQTAVVHYLHNAPFGWKFRQRVPRSGAALLTALIVVGMSGAIVALGDTLFPAASLLEGMKADFAAGQHFLIRLRILHPLLAMAVAAALIYAAWLGQTAGLGRRLVIPLVVGQILLGTANFLLLAPITLQILHLLLADFLWIAVMFWQLERSMSPILTPHFILRSNLPATSGG
jgi:heme A synthase